MQKLKPLQRILMNVFENFETIRGRFSNGLYVQNVYLAQAYSNIERQQINNCHSKSSEVEMEIGNSKFLFAFKLLLVNAWWLFPEGYFEVYFPYFEDYFFKK